MATAKVKTPAPKFTDAECMAIWHEASIAGREAATACIPEPMHVVQRADPFDDNSPIVKRWEPVMDGMCGFAWVTVRPTVSQFAKWLRKQGIGRYSEYDRGVVVWISEYNQSWERKTAHARAVAKVLRAHGIYATAHERLD